MEDAVTNPNVVRYRACAINRELIPRCAPPNRSFPICRILHSPQRSSFTIRGGIQQLKAPTPRPGVCHRARDAYALGNSACYGCRALEGTVLIDRQGATVVITGDRNAAVVTQTCCGAQHHEAVVVDDALEVCDGNAVQRSSTAIVVVAGGIGIGRRCTSAIPSPAPAGHDEKANKDRYNERACAMQHGVCSLWVLTDGVVGLKKILEGGDAMKRLRVKKVAGVVNGVRHA